MSDQTPFLLKFARKALGDSRAFLDQQTARRRSAHSPDPQPEPPPQTIQTAVDRETTDE